MAACAGQPSTPTPAPTRYITATGQPLASVSNGDIDEKRLADAKKRGYTLVNTDGQTLYCRSDFNTGSHVQKTTRCLTGPELDALQNQSRQSLQYLKPASPPPVGK